MVTASRAISFRLGRGAPPASDHQPGNEGNSENRGQCPFLEGIEEIENARSENSRPSNQEWNPDRCGQREVEKKAPEIHIHQTGGEIAGHPSSGHKTSEKDDRRSASLKPLHTLLNLLWGEQPSDGWPVQAGVSDGEAHPVHQDIADHEPEKAGQGCRSEPDLTLRHQETGPDAGEILGQQCGEKDAERQDSRPQTATGSPRTFILGEIPSPGAVDAAMRP